MGVLECMIILVSMMMVVVMVLVLSGFYKRVVVSMRG
jgi:hypothetical protein